MKRGRPIPEIKICRLEDIEDGVCKYHTSKCCPLLGLCMYNSLYKDKQKW